MEGFQIDTALTLEDNLKGVLAGRISCIRQQIRNEEDVHKAIHESRRSIKRIRAILRLIRDEIGYSDYFRENRFYRDLARRMAPVRDSFVLHQTFLSLKSRYPDLVPERDYSLLQNGLCRRIESDLECFMDERGGFSSILKDVGQASRRIDHYCQLRNSYRSVRKGIRRVYKRGRNHHFRIREIQNLDQFHEYRKNAKYLQFQMELMQPLFPKLLKAYAGTIDKHTELLGDIRDLDRLGFYIQQVIPGEIPKGSARRILEKFSTHRDEMMAKVISKSQMIYAEKPGEFIRRINIYWNYHYQLT